MRIVRRLLTLAVAASGLLLAGATAAAAAAAAQPYPIPPPVVTVSSGTITVGESVTLSGFNFGPGETVEITQTLVGSALGQLGRSAHAGLVRVAAASVVADGNGSFSLQLSPDVGRWVLTADGQTTGRTGSAGLRVLPVGSALPVTGSGGSYLGILLIGVAVSAAGIALVVFARARRRPSTLDT